MTSEPKPPSQGCEAEATGSHAERRLGLRSVAPPGFVGGLRLVPGRMVVENPSGELLPVPDGQRQGCTWG